MARPIAGRAPRITAQQLKQMQALFATAQQRQREGRLMEARAIGQTILAIDPGEPNTHHFLGLLAHRQGSKADAIAHLSQAVARSPRVAAYHADLGVALRADGRIDAAIDSFRTAIRLDPRLALAHSNLGNALAQEERFDEAEAAYRQALQLNPNAAGVHNNLGNVLKSIGKTDAAVESYRRAIALEPRHFAAWSSLGVALSSLGRFEEAMEAFNSALAANPAYLESYAGIVFHKNYLSNVTPEEMRADVDSYARAVALNVSALADHDNERDPERTLRVGFVSGDLNDHVVARFLMGVVEAMDRDRMELFAYATSPVDDAVSERLRKSMPNWRRVPELEGEALARRIQDDRIDILVDLAGFTRNNRLTTFARKPAPVQVTWLGYSGTTGLKAIDYIIGDRFVTPSGSEEQFAEAIWRMPDSYLCFRPPLEDVPVAPAPASVNGHVTFGSFNNLNKISPRTIGLWARVLDAVPGSRLLIKFATLEQPAVRKEIQDKFAAAGADPARLDLVGHIDDEHGHLAAYGRVDIALDPFPYNGTTTTCEALWMGVPVLTLKGDRFIARVGESLVNAVGLGDWVAEDEPDFIRRAVEFSTDLHALEELRQHLRSRMAQSPLCDAPRFASNFELALREMWRGWCAAQPGGSTSPADRSMGAC